MTAVRKKVEDVEPSFFERLHADDILFIDSSHVIRPGGDVLFEYLQLLPSLSPGVEAFLSHNREHEPASFYLRKVG